MKKLFLFLSLLIPITALSAPPSTTEAALAYLDSSPITPIEGLWKYQPDETIFLIQKAPLHPDIYEIILIDSPDCRLTPGDKIGTITPSVTLSAYTLNLFSKINKGILTNPLPITVTLSTDNATLRLDSQKLKFTISPSFILPRLFNILRIGIRMKPLDPLSTPADGWQKLYPPVPSPSSPIYL